MATPQAHQRRPGEFRGASQRLCRSGKEMTFKDSRVGLHRGHRADAATAAEEVRSRIRAQIARDLDAQRVHQPAASEGSPNLEQIRAHARQDWLKQKKTLSKESSDPELGRSTNRRGKQKLNDQGHEIDDESSE